MMTLLVNISGLLLMAAIVWWFWLYRPAQDVEPDHALISKAGDEQEPVEDRQEGV